MNAEWWHNFMIQGSVEQKNAKYESSNNFPLDINLLFHLIRWQTGLLQDHSNPQISDYVKK